LDRGSFHFWMDVLAVRSHDATGRWLRPFQRKFLFTRNERPRKTSHLKEGWFVVGIVLSTLNNITKIHVDDSGRYCIANKSHCKPLPLPAKEKRGTPFGRDYVSSQKGTWLVFICSYISYILIFLPWKQPSWFRILFVKHQRISSSQPRFSYPTQAERRYPRYPVSQVCHDTRDAVE